jgi:lipoate-protein ligase A
VTLENSQARVPRLASDDLRRVTNTGVTGTWRLLPLDCQDGPENMAVDEAILTLVGEGVSPPTLRFYTWQSPWISLGTAQSSRDLDPIGISSRGWGIVRRASGGTAVLHRGQLGYALILPADHPLWRGDLISSYQRLAQPIAEGLARLNIRVEPAAPGLMSRPGDGAPSLAARLCFCALGPYELLDGHRRKLIGNAQIRRRAAILQHGTVQISGGQEELVALLSGTDETERASLIHFLRQHVGSLEEAAGRPIDLEDVAAAITDGFRQVLGVRLAAGFLDADERALAAQLVRDRYANPSWTFRR